MTGRPAHPATPRIRVLIESRLLDDREISLVTGAAESVVRRARQAMGLSSLVEMDREAARREIAKTPDSTDTEIADRIGVHYTVVARQRRSQGDIRTGGARPGNVPIQAIKAPKRIRRERASRLAATGPASPRDPSRTLAMRMARAAGRTLEDIGREHGVTASTVYLMTRPPKRKSPR